MEAMAARLAIDTVVAATMIIGWVLRVWFSMFRLTDLLMVSDKRRCPAFSRRLKQLNTTCHLGYADEDTESMKRFAMDSNVLRCVVT